MTFSLSENHATPRYFWIGIASISALILVVSFIATSITLTPEFSKLLMPPQNVGSDWFYSSSMSQPQRTINFSSVRLWAVAGLTISGLRLWRWI